MTTVLIIVLMVVVLVALFIAFNVWKEKQWNKERAIWHSERKDLYDRLMAKDFAEYNEIVNPTPLPIVHKSKFVKALDKNNRKGGD